MRPIDADELLKVITENSYMLCDVINSRDKGMFLCGIEQAINEQPTVDTERHGRWIQAGQCNHKPYRMRNVDRWTIFKCSECGNNNGRRYNDKYCRFCGAKMDEVSE